jgi:hypothetical protein
VILSFQPKCVLHHGSAALSSMLLSRAVRAAAGARWAHSFAQAIANAKSHRLSPQELAAGVREINDEMDSLFGGAQKDESTTLAMARPGEVEPRPVEGRSGAGAPAGAVHSDGSMAQAFAQMQSLVHQQTALRQEGPSSPTIEVPEAAKPEGTSPSTAPIVQIFHAPVTLTQHFHVTVNSEN